MSHSGAKGVTPVIAVIMLLLITIALVAIVYVFFLQQTEEITTSVGADTQNTLNQLNTKVKIILTDMDVDTGGGPGPYTSKVYARNTGTVTIKDSSATPNLKNVLVVFIDTSLNVDGDWKKVADATPATEIAPGETVYYEIAHPDVFACSVVKIDTPGQSASATC